MGRDVYVLETVYGGQAGTWIGKTKCTPVNIWDYAGKEVAMFSYLSSLYYAWLEEMKAIDWDIVSMPSFKDLPKVGPVPVKGKNFKAIYAMLCKLQDDGAENGNGIFAGRKQDRHYSRPSRAAGRVQQSPRRL